MKETPEEITEGLLRARAADPSALEKLDHIARRLRLYASTIVLVGVTMATVVSGVVLWATRDVRAQISALNSRVAADSVRFERAMDVLELTAIALVEPDGSREQMDAIDQLRHRRRFGPVR